MHPLRSSCCTGTRPDSFIGVFSQCLWNKTSGVFIFKHALEMDLMCQNLLTISLCACVSVAGLVSESRLCVPLQWCGKFLGGGAAYGDWGRGRVMGCRNNKQILMIYYKSAAEASAWETEEDDSSWLTHLANALLMMCVRFRSSITKHTQTHTLTHTRTDITVLQKHAFNTRTQVHRPTHTRVCGHTHVSCL